MSDEPAKTHSNALRPSWQMFLDVYEPMRPELYPYCRHLTRSPWEAEDLVQDALARAFVTLGCLVEPPKNPRASLFRVASNLWIDRMRALRELPAEIRESSESSEPRDLREAAGTLLSRLAPQERAAVVLKDAFDLSLEEIAETLSTTVGAVKTALHRGRGKLTEESAPERERSPVPAVLDAFCAAFNMGKRMFDGGERHWPEDAPFHTPVFVLTHQARAPWERPGGTTFYFVNGGPAAALRRAREVAGGRDIRIGGGANTIVQFLNAGLVDEFHLAVAPVFFGDRIRLFDGIDRGKVSLAIAESWRSPLVTHLRYAVARSE